MGATALPTLPPNELPKRDPESRARLYAAASRAAPAVLAGDRLLVVDGQIGAAFSRRAVFGGGARLRSMGIRVRGRRPLPSRSPRPPPPSASGRRSSTPTERSVRAPRPRWVSRWNGARSSAMCRPIAGRRSSARCSTASRSSWPRSRRICGSATPAGSRPAPASARRCSSRSGRGRSRRRCGSHARAAPGTGSVRAAACSPGATSTCTSRRREARAALTQCA